MNLAASLAGLPAFILYYAGALLLTVGYGFVYTRVTDHDEIALIKANNPSAAIAFSGSILGFVVPLASAISNSVSVVDAFVWGVVALIVQVLAYLASRAVFGEIGPRITRGEIAAGVQLGVTSFAAGVLQAACMTY
jgi:putative membrane protein